MAAVGASERPYRGEFPKAHLEVAYQPLQQNPNASVYFYWTDPRREMFRPDPDAEHSVEDVIAKLTEVLAGVPHDSPRAQKLAEMIRGLRVADSEHRAGSAAPLAGIE